MYSARTRIVTKNDERNRPLPNVARGSFGSSNASSIDADAFCDTNTVHFVLNIFCYVGDYKSKNNTEVSAIDLEDTYYTGLFEGFYETAYYFLL